MYKPPIEIIRSQLKTEEENGVLKAIQNVEVVVDKDELIKALNYDRGQYDKGYSDGVKEFAERLKKVMIATHKTVDGYCKYETEDYYIDNLVKEMTEV